MKLFNFVSLTGVSGSASAERRFQPQKGYNPSPGSFTHSSIFPQAPGILVSFGGMSLPYGKSTFGGNGASDIDAT
jgi:hypothetical protein